MVHTRVERFNDHGRHPNKFISFIKEDRRTTTKTEQDKALGVLNRVAAIVHPIMKDNGLQITTLEEHPFNDSYAGINYDAGDCIGLVLRTSAGGWVPESYVLSVMLHELSHCTNMHHAAPFWKTLGLYRARMAQLREQGYTGEGFWSKGVVLGSEETASLAVPGAELPKALCGGAFRGTPFFRRKRKRAAGGTREKKLKPGEKLGGDAVIRNLLDGGKSKATPRVVKSKRGQELRAKAAELRFSRQLTEQVSTQKEDETDEYEEDLKDFKDFKPDWKVEDEDAATQQLLKQEMLQETGTMQQSKINFKPIRKTEYASRKTCAISEQSSVEVAAESQTIDLVSSSSQADTTDDEQISTSPSAGLIDLRAVDGEHVVPDGSICPICTLSSDPSAKFCDGCGTLTDNTEESWSCESIDCKSVQYLNHIDSQICGLCGCRRRS